MIVAQSAVFRDQPHGVGRKILEMAQRLAADLGHRRAIDEIVDLGELQRAFPPRGSRCRLGAPAGSQKTKRGFAALLDEITRDAGGQPAAADRQHDDVGHARRPASGRRYLVGDRRLPLDDVLVIEGRHHVARRSLSVNSMAAR